MPRDVAWYLLEVTEHLIEAHKLTKSHGDDISLALIGAALSHVGGRLKKEAEQHGLDGQKHGRGRGGDGSLSGS